MVTTAAWFQLPLRKCSDFPLSLSHFFSSIYFYPSSISRHLLHHFFSSILYLISTMIAFRRFDFRLFILTMFFTVGNASSKRERENLKGGNHLEKVMEIKFFKIEIGTFLMISFCCCSLFSSMMIKLIIYKGFSWLFVHYFLVTHWV